MHHLYVNQHQSPPCSNAGRGGTRIGTGRKKDGKFRRKDREGDVDEEFVTKHGVHIASSKKVTLLMRIIFPEFDKRFMTDDGVRMADKVDTLKVQCVTELIAALGMRHPFDTNTVIGDYWNDEEDPTQFEQSSLFRDVTAFREYEKTMTLFRGEKTHAKPWKRELVTHTMNTVLRCVGLEIEKTNSQNRGDDGNRRRRYSYRANITCVSEMLELVTIKLDAMGGRDILETNEVIRELLRRVGVSTHAHLLVPRLPPCEQSDDDINT
jgi:hypothetical protein